MAHILGNALADEVDHCGASWTALARAIRHGNAERICSIQEQVFTIDRGSRFSAGHNMEESGLSCQSSSCEKLGAFVFVAPGYYSPLQEALRLACLSLADFRRWHVRIEITSKSRSSGQAGGLMIRATRKRTERVRKLGFDASQRHTEQCVEGKGLHTRIPMLSRT